MRQLCLAALLLSVGCFVGCGASDNTPQVSDKSELEQFLAENPELASEEVVELDE